MPLAGRQGPPDQPVTDPDGTVPQTVVTMETALDQQEYIRDTFVNKTAFNPQTYAEQFGILQRYVQGSRIRVTYFLLSTPTGGLQRSDAIDQSNMRSALRTSYTQINDLEIVMQGPLKSTFKGESKETDLNGEALLYPGMRPRMGDEFIMSIGDSVYGIFRVTGVERLAYRQGSNHKITFFLNRYASDEDVQVLKQSVTEEVWFDKETYLGDTTTLLKSESYGYLKALRQMRLLLIRYYYNTFYDKKMSSIMSPEGIYDPYLVAYLNGKISISESIYRPIQLYPAIQNYENSIWSRLTDITNRRLTSIQPNWNLVEYRATRWDVQITSLINRRMISLNNPTRQAMAPPTDPGETIWLPGTQPPQQPQGECPQNIPPYSGWGEIIDPLFYISSAEGYVLSTNFYTGNKTAMTPFEFLVYAVIYDRKINDIGDLINSYLNPYTSLTFDEQYYFIPLYLWLIDVAISQISAPNDFFMT
jgi:hypothetical protein